MADAKKDEQKSAPADAPKDVPNVTAKEEKEKEPITGPEATVNEPDLIPVYNVNDGLVGRNGGPYLDEELAKEQEVRNARQEGREPDFSNLAAAPSPGIQLVTQEQLLRANIGRVGVGALNGEINAPVYGYIPNPVTVLKDESEAKEAALKREAEVDPRANVEVPDGAKPTDNNYQG